MIEENHEMFSTQSTMTMSGLNNVKNMVTILFKIV